MSNEEIEKVAFRVAEILGSKDQKSANGVALSPIREASPNEKHIEQVACQCVDMIISQVGPDGDQFETIARVRAKLSIYWENQLKESFEASQGLCNRSELLGKYIEMTVPR